MKGAYRTLLKVKVKSFLESRGSLAKHPGLCDRLPPGPNVVGQALPVILAIQTLTTAKTALF